MDQPSVRPIAVVGSAPQVEATVSAFKEFFSVSATGKATEAFMAEVESLLQKGFAVFAVGSQALLNGELERLKAISQAAKAPFYISTPQLFAANLCLLQQLIAAKALGQIGNLTFHVRGSFFNEGARFLRVLQWYFGDLRPKSLQVKKAVKTEVTAEAVLFSQGGVALRVATAVDRPRQEFDLRLQSERGVLTGEADQNYLLLDKVGCLTPEKIEAPKNEPATVAEMSWFLNALRDPTAFDRFFNSSFDAAMALAKLIEQFHKMEPQ
jgi:hypothetical protein